MSALFNDPHIRYPIYNLDLPFSDYIIQSQHNIATTRNDLHDTKELILTANSPYELTPKNPSNTGVLLLHGLLDTPFIMKDIGLRLQERCLVRSILLPGHGTVPGALLNVDYHAWLQAVKYGIHSFKNQVDKLYIVGFSTGASLALYHALHHAKIDGIVLLAPAIKIRSKLDFSTNWHRVISWAWERAKWLHIQTENDYAKYQSIPFNAGYQVYLLSHLIKSLSKTKKITCPLFYILTDADTTVSAQATMRYYETYAKPSDRMVIYNNELTSTNLPNTIIRESAFPKMNIEGISHIALPVSPSNPHYGAHGDYANASHIYATNTVYGAFSRVENMVYDFLYQSKLTSEARKRLTYNPDFDWMADQIMKFIFS